MKSIRLGTKALSGGVAIALLAGCGGSQPSVGAPGFINSAPPLRPAKGVSWMNQAAARDNLLYVSNTDSATVDVYSWPLLTRVGKLSGFKAPWTFCVDKLQDVYVTDTGLSETIEYAHGGTAPIRTLSDSFGSPAACAVDETMGDLAVVNSLGSTSGYGNVIVYPGGSGKPKEYTTSNIGRYDFVAYDPNGNLFVDGYGSRIHFGLSELPAKGSAFKVITPNVSLRAAGDIVWDGEYLAIADPAHEVIYQFTISGAKAIEQGSTALKDSTGLWQFFVTNLDAGKKRAQGNRAVGVDFYPRGVREWPYPAGGSPTKKLSTPSGSRGVIESKGKQ
jgi:hypothetical protein